MRTKTDDIKLPEPVAYLDENGGYWQTTTSPEELTALFTRNQMTAHARAAVEANRQARMPSDDEIIELRTAYDWRLPQGNIRFARALLSRYGSSQLIDDPAAYESGLNELVQQAADAIAREKDNPTTATTDDGQSAASAEPVGYVSRDSSVAHMHTNLPEGAPVYAAPVAAQVHPTMPVLTDAMRAVLRNEHDVYRSENDLYAALCAAANAIPATQPDEAGAINLDDCSDVYFTTGIAVCKMPAQEAIRILSARAAKEE